MKLKEYLIVEKRVIKKRWQEDWKQHKLEKFKDKEETDTIIHKVVNCICSCK